MLMPYGQKRTVRCISIDIYALRAIYLCPWDNRFIPYVQKIDALLAKEKTKFKK